MKKREILLVIFTLCYVLLLATYVYSADSVTPVGPDVFTISNNGRHTGTDSSRVITAEAGNVTALVITDQRVTLSWQGYYGNISGSIVLDDADNMTMYNWELPDPKGEIYASNSSSVTWGSIYCVNLTTNDTLEKGGPQRFNATNLELYFGMNTSDADGFSDTFNRTYNSVPGFFVGGIAINNEDGCYVTNTNVNQAWQYDYFEEVILTDNVSVIFTSIINVSADNFKTGTEYSDFQMIVAENGHPGFESSTTSYYFFIELS